MTLVRPDWQTQETFPEVPLFALDTVWFQVAGTLCNLECTHCFISSSPTNRSIGMLGLEDVLPYLAEARALGVRDYYFTGGEPFLNRELVPILEATLRQGPACVLTNGVSIKAKEASALAELSAASEYSLDLRVSLDGWDPASNDPIRGAGTFERILEGVAQLARVGLNPVITVTDAYAEAGTRAGRLRFLALLEGLGLPHPRLKVMPLLRMGAEVRRARGYEAFESLAGQKLTTEELDRLVCARSRMVTAQGVYVCPILVEVPGARLGRTLAESLSPFSLDQGGCFTCHAEGLSCAT